MRALAAGVTVALLLACGGLVDLGGPDEPGVSAEARAGCDALQAVLERRFSGGASRSAPGDGTCRLSSQGTLRGAGLPDSDLQAALADWTPGGSLAADGLDGTQFGLQKGPATCKIGIFWELVDMDTFETADERVEVACGPLDAVR